MLPHNNNDEGGEEQGEGIAPFNRTALAAPCLEAAAAGGEIPYCDCCDGMPPQSQTSRSIVGMSSIKRCISRWR